MHTGYYTGNHDEFSDNRINPADMYGDEWKVTVQTMGIRKLDPNNPNNEAATSSDTTINIHDRNIGNRIGMYGGERTKAQRRHIHILQINGTKTAIK
jgi:hypothetical protein